MYINNSIHSYINDLSARKPAPGGGSAAANCGALGAALFEMVCNFTLGNEKYKAVENDIRGYLVTLQKIREKFMSLIDEDVSVYTSIRDAFKTKDKKNIDKALKKGYHVSFKIGELSKAALEFGIELPEKGNPNLITDVGCGAELLNAAFNSSVFNSEVNLKGMDDKEFVEKERERLDILKKEVRVLYEDTILKTKGRMR